MSYRRQNGNLRKRRTAKGTVWFATWWDNNHRRGKTLGKTTDLTKTQAQEQLESILRPINERRKTVEYTLQGYTRDVVFPWYERKWKKSTAMTTRDRIDHHILKELGNKTLSSFDRTNLQDYLDKKTTTGLSHATLSHLRWDLRQIFRMAVNDGLLPRNPAELLHTPKGARHQKRYLTTTELQAILDLLPLRDRLILKLASIAGMRPGEILALQWNDLHADGFHITRGIYRGIIQTPKTHHSVRTAAVSTSIKEDLQAWHEIAPPNQEGWIFPNENGKPLAHGNYWRRHIKPTLDNLGLQRVTFQALRRTCATTLNTLGTDGKIVADQLA